MPPLSLKVSVAGPRVPRAVGVNVTLTTQVPFGAMGVPAKQVVVLANAKSVAFVPEIAGPGLNVSGVRPLFVTVTVSGLLAAFKPWTPKLSTLVESPTMLGVAPESAMVCVPALSETVAVALRAPVAEGVNVKLMMHEPFTCTDVSTVQVVPLATAKSPVLAPEIVTLAKILRNWLPVFVSVTFTGALVVFRIVGGKLTLVGFNVAMGPSPVPESGSVCVEPGTAPASSVMVNVAVRVPTPPGVKATAILQAPLAVRTAPLAVPHEVFPVSVKSAAFGPLMTRALVAANVSVSVPELVSVEASGVPAAPTF